MNRYVLIAAALVVPAATFTATSAARAGDDSPLQQVVDAGSPGAVALVNNGHAIRLQAKGEAHVNDRFRAGSITKSFVATVALQLVGEGKLSLSDSVERRLPGILPYGDRVTVRQLLNLTSGVPDNQDPVNAEFLKGNMTRSWTPRELVALVAGKRPDFRPGTGWAYSNTNYVLAGLMIERVTGHSLGAEVRSRILTPLHLRDSSFPINDTVIPGPHISGYAFVGDETRDVTVLNPSGTWASGNLV